MTNYDQVADRWVDRALGLTTRKPLSAREGRMYSDERDRIFSYGSHFEMGRFLRDRKNQPIAVLLNGDTYGVTTSRHQGITRQASARSRLPVVIIPHRALDSAGIDLDTVQIIDVQPDRNVETYHEHFTFQPGWQWRDEPVYETVDKTPEEIEVMLDKHHTEAVEHWEDMHGYAVEEQAKLSETPVRGIWAEYLDESSRPTRHNTVEEYVAATYYSSRDYHLYQESRKTVVARVDRNLYTSRLGQRRIDVEEMPDGRTRYSWTTTRHWLGGSLIRAAVWQGGFVPCKTCAGTGNGIGPLDRFDSRRWDRAPLCADCHGNRGRRWRRRQWAYYLSDFDHAEPSEVYFFCQLPRGVAPTTVAEAIECLKPDTVRIAEQMGRTVRRQGDIFAIELHQLTRKALKSQGARFERMGQLLGTNHVATEVAYLPDGSTLARGIMHHKPQWRRPDHVRVPLERDRWSVVLKNTVPLAA